MPKLTRGSIKANQNFLRRWDAYQLEWLNSPNFTKEKALFLPISVDISGGVMRRNRIKVPQVKSIMANAGALANDMRVTGAVQSYYDFFEAQDGSQSGTPPTPLDFYVNCPVVHLFHLRRDNWEFTDHTQFSVDNVPKGVALNKMFDVLGIIDDGQGLLVMNNNWTPGNTDKFRAKYNLHVSIFQEINDEEMRTDIIIDPGGNTNSGTQGGPGGGSGEGPGGG